MDTIPIKEELKALIEQEMDQNVLEAICTLLKKASQKELLKDKLVARAQRSNEDISEGRLLSKEEVERKTDHL